MTSNIYVKTFVNIEGIFVYIHNKDTYKVLEQKVDDLDIQSNLRKHYSNLGAIRGWHGMLYSRRWKVFKNQIDKKVPRSAHPPLDICYNNTQNTFLYHSKCEQVWAIFVFLINILIMKIIYDTNIPIWNLIENTPLKILKISFEIYYWFI